MKMRIHAVELRIPVDRRVGGDAFMIYRIPAVEFIYEGVNLQATGMVFCDLSCLFFL